MKRGAKLLLLRIHSLWERFRYSSQNKWIFIPDLSRGVGGPQTFVGLLTSVLKERGWVVTRNRYSPFAVALIPISWDIELISHWKKRGCKIVQRLDGLFYDPSSGGYDEVKNRECAKIYHELADTVVFQSEYSKSQCSHFLQKSGAKVEEIILNGTNLSAENPRHRPSSSWKFVATGNFRDRSMIEPLLTALDKLYMKRKDFELNLLGPVSSEWSELLKHKPYLKHEKCVSREGIEQRLKEAHVFIFSFLNPNCPNSVIEAVGCGLPVVSFDSGAMMELCGFNAELLAKVSERVVQVETELSGEKLFEKLELCLLNYEKFAESSFENRLNLRLETSVDAYESLLTGSL